MSQENVEIVKRGLDVFSRRDLDVFDEIASPDLELVAAMSGIVEAWVYRGREGIEWWVAEINEVWAEYGIVVKEVRDLGDRVLVLGRLQGRGKVSGATVDAPYGQTFEFLD